MPSGVAATQAPMRRRGRRAGWMLALSAWVLFAGALGWLATIYLKSEERAAIAAGLVRAEVAAGTVEQSLLRTLEAIEALHRLAEARHRLAASGDEEGAAAVADHLRESTAAERFGVLQLGEIGADGWLRWSTVPDFERVFLGDREHFQIHATQGHAGLFVSAPVFGRASGRWSIQFTRPMRDAGGAFAGVAVVSLDPFRLSQHLAELHRGGADNSLIFRLGDGMILASGQEPPRWTSGDRLPETAMILRQARSTDQGAARIIGAFSGKDLLVGFRGLGEAALGVSFALSTDRELSVLGSLRTAVTAVSVGASLLALAILVGAKLWFDRRRAQAELASARVENELAQARLADARRMEALGALAGGVAHDFNNVLQAVLGGARVIARRASDTALVERTAAMLAETAERGASVTRRLLTLARRGDLRAEPLDPPEVLGGLQEVLAHTLGAGIQVRIAVSDRVPLVLADRGQFENVLVNLAVNARDAMEPLGGGTLTLAAAPEVVRAGRPHPGGLAPGRYVRFSVTDTGTGMDLETLARACEPFFSTKPKGRGTGLGLAMARGFAEQSGGALRIESERGRGTKVILWLPQAERALRPQDQGGGALGDVVRAVPRQAHRILLVDDDPRVRIVLAQGLSDLGLEVSQAEDGLSALALIEAGERCDLLVTDLSMPGMSGLALIRGVRERRPGLPALLLTGHAADASDNGLREVAGGGIFVLLRKPVTSEVLAHRAAAMIAEHTKRAGEGCARADQDAPPGALQPQG